MLQAACCLALLCPQTSRLAVGASQSPPLPVCLPHRLPETETETERQRDTHTEKQHRQMAGVGGGWRGRRGGREEEGKECGAGPRPGCGGAPAQAPVPGGLETQAHVCLSVWIWEVWGRRGIWRLRGALGDDDLPDPTEAPGMILNARTTTVLDLISAIQQVTSCAVTARERLP